MTFKEMQDEVLAHGFAESYRTRVKTWLNTAQARIFRDVETLETHASATNTTVVGTDTYAFAANNAIIESIIDEDLGFQLEVSTLAEVEAANANGTYNGRPLEYAIAGSSEIIFSPVPDAVYDLTINYQLRPADLSADGDVSTLPPDFHDVMVSWTLSRSYRSEDDAQMAQFYMAEYQRDLMLLGTNAHNKSDDPTQVRGTWG